MWHWLGIEEWKCWLFSVRFVKMTDESQHPTLNPSPSEDQVFGNEQGTIPAKGLRGIYHDSGLVL